jgi:hypothetical protein
VAPAPRRSRGPVLIAVIVVVVLILAIIGYVGAGFAVAAGQISSADKTLNAVITNENAITAQFNSSKAASALDTKATAAELQTNKTAVAQLVTQSQAAQPTITSDDASLASAQDSLKNNSWLTALSKSSLDQKSAKITHWRNALASAKTITTDYALLGTFVQSYDDTLIDFDNLITKSNASDFTGIAAALGSLKTDSAKAISLAGAPGLPPDMKAFLTDLQTEGDDFSKLLNDAIAGAADTTVQADINKIGADDTKLAAHDIIAINTAITAFYGTLIDAYNSEVSKANAM